MLLYNRKAFTMIELIFVVVIIGILSGLALPSLLATRNDAEVSTIIVNTKNIITDVKSFYTAKSEVQYLNAKTPQITSIPLYLNPTCRTRATMTQRNFVGSTLYLCPSKGALGILQITTTNSGAQRQTITLKQVNTGTMLSNLLSSNQTFYTFTQGTTGRTYNIGGSKVTP